MTFECAICSESLTQVPPTLEGASSEEPEEIGGGGASGGGGGSEGQVQGQTGSSSSLSSTLPKILATPCGHMYHDHCLRRWLHSNRPSNWKCPCCRKIVKAHDCVPLYPSNSQEEGGGQGGQEGERSGGGAGGGGEEMENEISLSLNQLGRTFTKIATDNNKLRKKASELEKRAEKAEKKVEELSRKLDEEKLKVEDLTGLNFNLETEMRKVKETNLKISELSGRIAYLASNAGAPSPTQASGVIGNEQVEPAGLGPRPSPAPGGPVGTPQRLYPTSSELFEGRGRARGRGRGRVMMTMRPF